MKRAAGNAMRNTSAARWYVEKREKSWSGFTTASVYHIDFVNLKHDAGAQARVRGAIIGDEGWVLRRGKVLANEIEPKVGRPRGG